MSNNNVQLKPVKDLLGMNFHIPAYQRGYRWKPQQALDLLNDIMAFTSKAANTSEIYCIQPLVVQRRDKEKIMAKIREAASIQQVEKFLNESWDVVDGQQRLTTIFLIIKCLRHSNPYSIEFQTRNDSKAYLDNENGPDASMKNTNIDFYHIYNIWFTITTWLNEHSEEEKKKFEKALLDRVNFIWYQIDDNENAISVFTRLNVGKIPLTDSELIKALFLNRSNFNDAIINLETQQHEIAMQWDQIEYTLQNDEFWLFLHDKKYEKPTRIDYILDLICADDKLKLKKKIDGTRGRNRKDLTAYNDEFDRRIGNDEHKTFRYFYEGFSGKFAEYVGADTDNWLLKVWGKIHDIYLIFDEWYHNYKLYHYIGYLVSVKNDKNLMNNLIALWETKTKSDFLGSVDVTDSVKGMIKAELLKISGFADLDNFKYDEEVPGKAAVEKSKCKPILLLHNIETLIQQNERLIQEKKYTLPAFSKFPFHLYKRENWDVEHIRPNAGDSIPDEKTKKLFLSVTKQYCQDAELSRKIDAYLLDSNGSENFDELYLTICTTGDALPDSEKNKIWNYTLLDKKTNQEYQNYIFPIKRLFIIEKERGHKLQYSFDTNGNLVKNTVLSNEIAFVPPCTKNIFTKSYTDIPSTMASWKVEDAQAYLADMKAKLAEYLI